MFYIYGLHGVVSFVKTAGEKTTQRRSSSALNFFCTYAELSLNSLTYSHDTDVSWNVSMRRSHNSRPVVTIDVESCRSAMSSLIETRSYVHLVSVETFRSRDGLGLQMVSRRTNVSSRSHLGLGAICLGLDPVGLVSGLGPLRLVETFCAGARRAYCSSS